MVTIKDIAKECHVSVSTVSRAINSSRDISDNKKEYILRVCKEMGYRPNAVARSLVKNKSNMIGLILPDITNQYYAYISKGVGSYLAKYGYGLLLCNSDRNEAYEKQYFDFLATQRVAGAIIISVGTKKNNYKIFFDNKVPFVLADNNIRGLNVSFIGNDNFVGAKKIIMHMLDMGYRRIAAIMGNPDASTTINRLMGYKDAYKESGIHLDEDIIVYSKATFQDGLEKAAILLDKNIDAIFAINDTVAMGVFQYCHEHKIDIPKDLGLGGYDDIEQAKMLQIPLTTIQQPQFSLGEKAAEVLINEINSTSIIKQKIILQPRLIIRKSCGE